MRKLLMGILLALAAEGAALACSCIAPPGPEESRAYARQAVERAVAIVEADVLSEYRPGGPGEQVRVRRILWGEAPPQFRISRRGFASSASCDLLLSRGERKVLILYAPEQARPLDGGKPLPLGDGFAIQSLCSDFLVSDRFYLAVTLEEARRRTDSVADGQRG